MAAAVSPWWLSQGDEECPHCEGDYIFETEVRCVQCDAPICPMCVVRVGRRVLCPGCKPRPKSGGKS